jgi:glycosyltransferase involved in cell wall biosynthesis
MPALLLISHAFPPSGASGAHRPVKMAKFLARAGWRVSVVTARAARYPLRDDSLAGLVPETVSVHRAFSVEPPSRRRVAGGDLGSSAAGAGAGVARRLNRRMRSLLVPDELVGWLPFAVAAALRIHARQRCDAILSTAPELTNHLVARVVSRVTGLPWIADFRDPCAFNPFSGLRSRAQTVLLRRFERNVIRAATLTLATTEPMAEFFKAEYPEVARERVRVLTNGFDPDDFAGVPVARGPEFAVTHAGALYGLRTALPFLAGVRALLDRSPRLARDLRCRFLGVVPERERAEIARLGLSEVVTAPGHVSHRETLARLVASDLLLLLTGDWAGSAMYVPRKAYEYLGAGNPILALTTGGAVAALIASTSSGVVVPADEPAEIARALEAFLQARALDSPLVKRSDDEVAHYRWDRIGERLRGYLLEVVG